jgi:DNA-binding phage protein
MVSSNLDNDFVKSGLRCAALALGAKPRYDTVLKVLRALGVKLNVESVHV